MTPGHQAPTGADLAFDDPGGRMLTEVVRLHGSLKAAPLPLDLPGVSASRGRMTFSMMALTRRSPATVEESLKRTLASSSTVTPSFLRWSAISRSACWAWATAMP